LAIAPSNLQQAEPQLDDVVLYKVERGERIALSPLGRQGDHGQTQHVTTAEWHTLGVRFQRTDPVRVYSTSMRRAAGSLLAIGWLALLGAQLTGAHGHLDEHGFDGGVQSTHEHHHDDGDDHDGDVDLHVVDFGLGTSKVIFLLAVVGITLFLLTPTRSLAPFALEILIPLSRRQRWRPPLRGPPR
jgi:hypothetical protein